MIHNSVMRARARDVRTTQVVCVSSCRVPCARYRETYLESAVGNQFQVTISRAHKLSGAACALLSARFTMCSIQFVVGTDHC